MSHPSSISPRRSALPGWLGVALIFLGCRAFAVAEADLLIAYDQSHSAAVGGQDNANVLAANAVAGSNAINDRSGTGARVRIVGYHQAEEYSYQRTSKGGFVNWMASYDPRISDVVDAGNARGADLVTFICVSTADGAAAVAQQPGRYSAFDPGSFWAAVVAHELGGHNYGCDHRGGRENPKTVMMHNYCGGGAAPPYFFSNPNIWLNGVRLLGEGSCLGAAVDGGDNAYLISSTSQGVADRNARAITAPNLGSVVRRWSFNQAAGNAPAGTTVTDAVSGSALATVQGSGAVFTGEGLRLPGGAAASGAAYLQLPSGVLSGYTNATVEFWAKAISVQNWSRLLDFNNGTGNYIMLTSSIGGDLNAQRFESANGGAYVGLDSGIPTAAGVMHHYAATYASTGPGSGRWTWYRDGDEIAYLDVAYALSSLQDVNAWLGRSAYAGDNLANAEYAEVRVSNVAMSRDQVAANARLGPNRVTVNANLTGDDPVGQASFAAAGLWSDGLAPGAGKHYETYGFRLRTPADGTSRTFAGQSLKLTGGSVTWKGTSNSTTTINDLTLLGTDGELLNAGAGIWTLAGNLKAEAPETMVRAGNGPIQIAANLSGAGSLLHVNNTVTLSGSNGSFTGKTLVGDGRFGRLAIDSEARLGGNPASFKADQLTLNRGILFTNSNQTFDDSNRGIRIGVSAGIFNVGAGTTLTLDVPLSSPASGDALVTAPIFPNPVSGMLIKENTGTLILTHPNNSYVGEIIISGGSLVVQGGGRMNNGDTPAPVVINGTLNMNTTADQTLGGAISGGGTLLKNNSGTLSLYGSNPFTGAVTVNAGTLYARAANAANNRNFSQASGITVNNGGTLRASANALFGWDGSQEKPVTVNAGGSLVADGGGTGDVGVGTVTLAGGTMSSLAASPAWGSWRFDEETDKLLVTADSTVSATNVKFGNANAAIEVSATRTLNFTGTITNATNGGTSYLRKTGAGTLVLGGVNTYTGATAITAGTVRLNGSLAAGTAVTVSGAATLTGTGTANGSVSFAATGKHMPGNGTGTQTVVGALDYAADSRLQWTLPTNSDAAGASGRVAAGSVTVTAGALVDLVMNHTGSTVDFNDVFWTQPHSWTLMSCSAKTGDFTLGTVSNDAGGRLAADYGSFTLQQSGTGVTVNYVPNSSLTPSEAWRQANFGEEWNNPLVSGDPVDGDFDGLANVLEYALGSNPNVADASSSPQVTIAADKLRISFTRNTAASDITLAVVASDHLVGGWTAIASSVNGAAFSVVLPGAAVSESGAGAIRNVQATDVYLVSDPAHTHRFMRLEVTR
jgi:autotransporter-associated beta strand protein